MRGNGASAFQNPAAVASEMSYGNRFNRGIIMVQKIF